MTNTLFSRLGGEPAVTAAVDIFYRKVLLDRRINRFFEHMDVDALRDKQRAFLTMVLGGRDAYQGRDLRSAHARLLKLGLDDLHFDAVAELLEQTLQELGVPAELVAEVSEIVASTRTDVLGR
ncbi:MAG: globin [Deltaproteobacteria bacterium]|nr:globin [Deltaproteobacteria bacterium]